MLILRVLNIDIMKKFKLRFNVGEISYYSNRYDYSSDIILPPIIERTKREKQLRFEDFLAICEWKTKRTKSRCASNDSNFVKECSRVAFSTGDERLRIEVLTLLTGVSWPTASTILHFCHDDKYPILDFRALWSLGINQPPVYNFKFWIEYTKVCRNLAFENSIDMRTLDMALWQYSKENQNV